MGGQDGRGSRSPHPEEAASAAVSKDGPARSGASFETQPAAAPQDEGSRGKPAVIVVMGVASSGKTSLGERLAEQLGWPFRDADSFHPPENVAKMSGGIPLTDEDRKPWLAAIAAWIDELRAAGQHGIVTCSALKKAYRRVIIGDRPDVALVYLKGSRELIGARMAARRHHFMPPALLDSQFAALEEPGAEERPLVVQVEASKDAIVERVLDELDLG